MFLHLPDKEHDQPAVIVDRILEYGYTHTWYRNTLIQFWLSHHNDFRT